jgi:hypothetical protein
MKSIIGYLEGAAFFYAGTGRSIVLVVGNNVIEMKSTELIFEELLKYKDRLIAEEVWAGMDTDEKKEPNKELVRKSKSKGKT